MFQAQLWGLLKMKANKYFSVHSKEYDKKRKRGVLGKIVEKEKKIVLELLKVKSGDSVLDLGCGAGYYAGILKEKGADVFGVDISQEMIIMLKNKGIQGIKGDIQKIYLGKKFDKVLCAGALEFVEHPEMVVKNAAAHLRKNGLFVLLYPKPSFFGRVYQLYHLSHGMRIRLFSIKIIKKLFEDSGFENVYIVPAGINCNAAAAFAKHL